MKAVRSDLPKAVHSEKRRVDCSAERSAALSAVKMVVMWGYWMADGSANQMVDLLVERLVGKSVGKMVVKMGW